MVNTCAAGGTETAMRIRSSIRSSANATMRRSTISAIAPVGQKEVFEAIESAVPSFLEARSARAGDDVPRAQGPASDPLATWSWMPPLRAGRSGTDQSRKAGRSDELTAIRRRANSAGALREALRTRGSCIRYWPRSAFSYRQLGRIIRRCSVGLARLAATSARQRAK